MFNKIESSEAVKDEPCSEMMRILMNNQQINKFAVSNCRFTQRDVVGIIGILKRLIETI